MSLKYDPSLMPETKQRDDLGNGSDVFLALHGVKIGNVEIDHSKFLGRAVLEIRGCG